MDLSYSSECYESEKEKKLMHKKKMLVKEALWALSNIAACPSFILEQLLED